MILNPNEAGKFYSFFCFAEQNTRGAYRLVFADKSSVDCAFDTCCESDNCLDLDDPGYEEYLMIVFKNLATGKLFEVNYHNMPAEVFYDGERVPLDE